MPIAMNLKEEACSSCNEEELYYWSKDETESVIEVYMNCDNCGREYSKIVINKSDDTSESAIQEILKERRL